MASTFDQSGTRDADLLAAWRAGQHDRVLAGLMARYRQKSLHLATALVGDASLAEDMAQLGFVKAWQALGRYDGRASLSTWLYAIVRNTCLSELRRRGRELSLDTAPELEGVEFDEGRDRAGEAGASADATKLLDGLAEPARSVVILYYLEDRSCEEVGELLGMPEGTVKSHLHRARRQLALAAGVDDAHRGVA